MNERRELSLGEVLGYLGSEGYWTERVTGEPAPVSSSEPIRLIEARRPLIIEVLQRDGRTVFDLDNRELVRLGVETLGAAVALTATGLLVAQVPEAVGAISNGISSGIAEIGNFVRGVPDLSLGEIARIPFYQTPKYLAQGLFKAVEIPFHCARLTPTPTCGEISTVSNVVKTAISTGVAAWEEKKLGLLHRYALPLIAKGPKAAFKKQK